MILSMIILPILSGVLVFFLKPAGPRRVLLLLTAVEHFLLTALAWVRQPAPSLGGWLLLDAPGLLFLSITSILFLMVAIYAIGYFQRENWGQRQDFEEGLLFSNAREPTFTCCLLIFLSMMTLVTVSQHFGLLWVAIEATTLASAPMIYFHRHSRSLEATWKYIMICSVGIALALLGNFFLAVASTVGEQEHVPMLIGSLVEQAPGLHVPWLKAAFLLFFVGYGTKMGLAPLHTWLPDAHSESPSLVSALLSGALLNCAFLGILRVQQVAVAAGIGSYGRGLMLGFGLFSMLVAAAFIVGQTDFKRMLAYSSVEHMGILSLAIGLGAEAGFGAMLHAVNHSLTKGMLFLTAGNILALYRSKSTTDIRGVARMLPVSGTLWVVGFLAITGSPPFGTFLSELVILKSAIDQGRMAVAACYLVLLCIIFIGIATIVLRMVQGKPAGLPADVFQETADTRSSGNGPAPIAESMWAVGPPLALSTIILMLGIYIPPPLRHLLEQAAKAVGAG
jgi:hydrogenase-4 component F